MNLQTTKAKGQYTFSADRKPDRQLPLKRRFAFLFEVVEFASGLRGHGRDLVRGIGPTGSRSRADKSELEMALILQDFVSVPLEERDLHWLIKRVYLAIRNSRSHRQTCHALQST